MFFENPFIKWCLALLMKHFVYVTATEAIVCKYIFLLFQSYQYGHRNIETQYLGWKVHFKPVYIGKFFDSSQNQSRNPSIPQIQHWYDILYLCIYVYIQNIYIYIIYIYTNYHHSGFLATCRLWTASDGVHALLLLINILF